MDELWLMSNKLIDRMCELKRREQAEASGEKWEPEDIPEPADPDAPPPRDAFVAYACALGKTEEWAELEYERQVKNGGYGKVVDKHGIPY